MKKLLLITFLLFFSFSFAQQKEKNSNVFKKTELTATILSVAAYPNPLTTSTKINFVSTKQQLVEFSVKNLVGKTVFGERINANIGRNSIAFNRNDLPNGMYIYTVQSDSEIISKRLVIR